MVLKRPGCFWVTSFPFARYVKHEWAGAWVCSAFRREYGPVASVLIKEAVARTVQFHFDKPSWAVEDLPQLGMVTFIDERKVRDKQDFGHCYLMAGFKFAGRTKKDDLLALQLPVTKAIDIWIDYHQAGKFYLG
jgi:hypothetical protein